MTFLRANTETNEDCSMHIIQESSSTHCSFHVILRTFTEDYYIKWKRKDRCNSSFSLPVLPISMISSHQDICIEISLEVCWTIRWRHQLWWYLQIVIMMWCNRTNEKEKEHDKDDRWLSWLTFFLSGFFYLSSHRFDGHTHPAFDESIWPWRFNNTTMDMRILFFFARKKPRKNSKGNPRLLSYSIRWNECNLCLSSFLIKYLWLINNYGY